MSVNLELYRIFYCVVKNGSITNAAKELFISQPAVSQSIKQLEAQLGGRLFLRTPKGMELTPEGSAIYEYVERANGLLSEAENKFNQLKNLVIGKIRIGASDNICRNYLLPYVRQFRTLYPDVKIHITNGTSNQTINLLKTGKVDIGFVNMPSVDDEVEVSVCSKLHDCFVAGSKFIDLKDIPMTIETLLNYPIILLEKGTNSRRFIDDYIKSFGHECEPNIEVGSHDLLIEFAKQNLGISCVTEEFVTKELKDGSLFKLNIEGDIRSRNIGYVKLKNVSLTFAGARFIDLIQEDLNNKNNR